VACRPTLSLAAGDHVLTSGAGAGISVNRVVLDGGGRDAIAVAAASADPTATVTSSSRLRRTAAVDGCPNGCWFVLGEGHHDAWSASVDGVDLGPPQLVDGGFNGWLLPPSASTTVVDVRWTAQTPLTVALILTVAALAAYVTLAAVDRRRSPVPVTVAGRGEGGARFEGLGPPVGRRWRWIAGAAWVVAATLLVGPAWGLAAAVLALVLVLLIGRPRWAGVVALAALAVVAVGVLYVVRRDRPPPDGGWPLRFERVHELGLFAAVSLLVTAFTPRRREP
jgi:arabinofuranan 3-O-arabinosyltransferase